MTQLRKIMVVSRSGDHTTIKRDLLDTLRRKKIPYSKNEGSSVITENVSFHFFALDYRNLGAFRRTHKKMDKVYFLRRGILEEVLALKENKNGLVEKLRKENVDRQYMWHLSPLKAHHLLELVDNDVSRFAITDDNSPAVLLRELDESILKPEIVDVYEIGYWNELTPKTILMKDFVLHKHYRTREDAIAVMKHAAQEKVRRAKSDLQDAERDLAKVLKLEREGETK